MPPDFVSVRIEGPGHGPVAKRRQDLKPAPDGGFSVAVPRKALLQVDASAKDRLTVSIYAQDDPTFRTPVFRGEVRGGSAVKVPAGDHLVSLLASGRAPDLHLLSAPPGGSERLVYHPRSGWSLVVRAQSEGTPVQGAAVDVAGMEGFSGGPSRGRRSSRARMAS